MSDAFLQTIYSTLNGDSTLVTTYGASIGWGLALNERDALPWVTFNTITDLYQDTKSEEIRRLFIDFIVTVSCEDDPVDVAYRVRTLLNNTTLAPTGWTHVASKINGPVILREDAHINQMLLTGEFIIKKN